MPAWAVVPGFGQQYFVKAGRDTGMKIPFWTHGAITAPERSKTSTVSGIPLSEDQRVKWSSSVCCCAQG